MNKIIICCLVCVLLVPGALYAEKNCKVSLKKSSETSFKINRKKLTGFSAMNAIGDIGLSTRNTPDGTFTELGIEGYSKSSGEEGTPDLPIFTKLIQIPYGASVTAVVDNYDIETISLTKKGFAGKLMPVQPPQPKNTPLNQRKFSYNAKAYTIDDYNTEQIVKFEKIGVLRGVWVGKLTISPFRYNPHQNSLMVYNNIRYDLIYKNGDTVFSEKMRRKYLSPVFKSVTSSIEMLPDSSQTSKSTAENDSSWPLTYIIVAHSDFKGSKLNEFIRWKRESGFNVVEAYTDDADFNTSTTIKLRKSIHTYLKDKYISVQHSYVLFVGDVEKIPPWSGKAGDHVTDLYYCTYDENSDYVPDVFYGRFPADDSDDLEAIVNKTLQYEKYQFVTSSADFLARSLFVAGYDEDGNDLSHGNGQVNYIVSEYFKFADSYFSPGVYASTIIDKFYEGTGFVNYTGHCDETGWMSELDVNDVHNFSANDKFGLVIGNCCLTNKFDENDCLGEELVKEERAGAVGYIGASNNSYWYEDFYWSVGNPDLSINETTVNAHTKSNTGTGVYDALFHDISGMTTDSWYITAGQIIHRGNLSVMEVSSEEDSKYYWEIYHLMGDPSLIPFLEKPLVYSTTPSITSINTCATTECVISPLEENSYVGLSQNGVLVDSAYSGNDFSVNLSFSAIETADPLTLVVTKQNRQPYVDNSIIVTSAAPEPNADFSFNSTNLYSGASVSFTNLSSGCDNKYTWTLGGSATGNSEEKNPDVIFDQTGAFAITLLVSNSHGPDSETTKDIIISPKIKAESDDNHLDVDGICSIAFEELSTNHTDISSWEWSFPGGTPATSTAISPTVTYNTADWYSASLVVMKIVAGEVVPYASNTIDILVREKLASQDGGGGSCFIGHLE